MLLLLLFPFGARAGGVGEGSTLGFVLDHSGSMTEEIAEIRLAIADIVAAVSSGALAPEDYLLVVFSDPEVSVPFVTPAASALLSAIEAVEPVAGGDCPDRSLAAILAAIGAARPGSDLFVYTDADAKDEELSGIVAAAAVAKGISLSFVLTGACSGFDPDPVYLTEARETGGAVFLLLPGEVGAYFELVDAGLPGDLQPILIAEDDLEPGFPVAWTVPIDATLAEATFAVSIEAPISMVVRRPNGLPVIQQDADASITPLSTGRIVRVTAPTPGDWTLEIEGNGFAFVSASGNSDLAFEAFDFVDGVSREPIPGQPLIGSAASYEARVVGLAGPVSFDALDPRGVFVQALPAAPDGPDQWFGSSALAVGSMRAYARGTDPSGFAFQRAYAPAFGAQSVLVEPPPDGTLLEPGVPVFVTFRVTNLGGAGTFDFTAADPQGLVDEVLPASAPLAGGGSVDVVVTMSTGEGAQPGADALTLVAESAADPDVRNFAQTEVQVQAGAECAPAPRTDCFETLQPGKSKLTLSSGKQKVSWSWKKGQETTLGDLGDPVGGDTHYAFCVYDSSNGFPERVVDELIPAGPAWKAKKTGFRFKGAKGVAGVDKIQLKAGAEGKPKVSVKGKGLPIPQLPITPDFAVTAQLVNGDGACWSAGYASPARSNSSKKFTAKSQ